jgi:urea transporter
VTNFFDLKFVCESKKLSVQPIRHTLIGFHLIASTMPEEVNAWASYDKTAKVARNLTNGRGRNEVLVTASAHEQLQAVELGRSRRRSSELDVSRRSSELFNTYPGDHIDRSRHSISSLNATPRSTLNTSRHGGVGYFQFKLMEAGKNTTHLQYSDMKTKDGKLSDDRTREQIRSLFEVFFEGSSTVAPSDDHASVEKFSIFYPCRIISACALFNATMPWVQSYIKSEFLLFIEFCFRGVSQVYFQNNPMSGLLILFGLIIQSPMVALHGVIGLVCGNLVAALLGFDKGLARSGLFGYNAFLVGLALGTFLTDDGEENSKSSLAAILVTVIFSSFSSVIFVMLGKLLVPYKSPPLTLPFNAACFMCLLASANMGRVTYYPVVIPALPEYATTADFTVITARDFFAGAIRGIGQVYFADNIVSGCLILAGIAVCSRIGAAAALFGSALGGATALATGVDPSMVTLGMYGFNSSLSVTAMFFFYAPTRGAAVLAVFTGSMTVLGQQALATTLQQYGLPVLTMPFCIIALPFVILQGTSSIVISVPLASMTVPEDHLRRIHTLEDGFALLMEAINPEDYPTRVSKIHSQKTNLSLRQLSVALDGMQNGADRSDAAATASTSKSKEFIKRSFPVLSIIKGEDSNDASLRDAALSLFESLDTEHQNILRMNEITNALHDAGLRDKEGLHFAGLVLNLVDLDDSFTIDRTEFVIFAFVARAIRGIRRKVSKFFDFVDSDGNALM